MIGTWKELDSIAPFEFKDLQSCKNRPLEQALVSYRGTGIEPLILDFSKHLALPYLYVDVKVHYLQKNIIPCIPGWHLDGGFSHRSEYVLMTAGSSLTEFNSSEYEVDTNQPMLVVNKQLSALPEERTFSAKAWTPVVYDYLMPHRGSPAKHTGPRFLLRVMASTDKKIPETKDFVPGYYK